MKKILIALLVALSVFALVSCDHEVASSSAATLEIVSTAIHNRPGEIKDYAGTFYIDSSKALTYGSSVYYYELYSDKACTTKVDNFACSFCTDSTFRLMYNFTYTWFSNPIPSNNCSIEGTNLRFTTPSAVVDALSSAYDEGSLTITCYDLAAAFVANQGM